MLRGGEGIRADPARAAALFQRLCDGDHPEGCHDLSLQYRSGSGVPRDVERAAVLLKQACDRGDSDACPQRRLFAAVRPKPGTPRDPSCGGSYRLDGYGLFSFSKDVSTEQGCASVGMEDVQAACRMNHAAAGTKATAMYRFRRGVVDVTKGFIAKCR
jgi:TPR repeat protein